MNNKIMTLKDTKNNNRIGGGIFFNSDKSSKKYNFVDLNINNRNIQKLLSYGITQEKIPQEINTLYLSNYNFYVLICN